MQKERQLIFGSNKLLKILVPVFVLLVATSFLNKKMFDEHQQYEYVFNYNFLTPTTVSNIHMGYQNLWAQLLWIKVLAYFGSHLEKSNYRYIAQRLTLITILNPKSEHAYYMAASILPWGTGNTRLSRPLLEKAMREFPKNWLWPYYLGFHAYWFDNDTTTAIHYLNIAASLPNVHPMVKELSLRMLSTNGKITTAIAFLESQIKHTQDPQMKSQLQQQQVILLTEEAILKVEKYLNLLQLPHNMDSINKLKKMGYPIPNILPDHGTLVFSHTGTLTSSKHPKRFKIFIPPKHQGVINHESTH